MTAQQRNGSWSVVRELVRWPLTFLAVGFVAYLLAFAEGIAEQGERAPSVVYYSLYDLAFWPVILVGPVVKPLGIHDDSPLLLGILVAGWGLPGVLVALARVKWRARGHGASLAG
jgi:hypothetical protein